MTRGTGERIYRACQRCRERKSKCELFKIGEPGKPPCYECYRTGHHCDLAGSRRGGDYTHLRKSKAVRSREKSSFPNSTIAENDNNTNPSLDGQDEEFICAEMKNPLDALQILSKVATTVSKSSEEETFIQGAIESSNIICSPGENSPPSCIESISLRREQTHELAGGIASYKLVEVGALKADTIIRLVKHYVINYHPFLPLAPNEILTPRNIKKSAAKEAFLLTAILTIASKDDPDILDTHTTCWGYMKELLLYVLLGHPSMQQIGSVEGLLLLSDWLPHVQFEYLPSNVGSTTKYSVIEDTMGWSLVGQAVRQAYLLGLDRTCFRNDSGDESKDQIDRKRLVWSFVYIADRQISVRMGQSFWSRGPSLSTQFTTRDFPTLLPAFDGADDYASVLQATIELTQILHNAHSILYSSKSRTVEMMRAGDYSRYLDDFQSALSAWHHHWDKLKVSLRLKSSLSLMYEYLCLYVNAFSFQSVVARASANGRRSSHDSGLLMSGIMASPDGHFVFQAIRAAKKSLIEFITMDAASVLRYMPSRFYLYGIYSAVFLSRAKVFGALNTTKERDEVATLIRDFGSALQSAATGEHHIGLRYSKLLKGLWFPTVNQTVPKRHGISENENNPDDTSNEIVSGKHLVLDDFANIEMDTSAPTWADNSAFDPFWGSCSYFGFDNSNPSFGRRMDFDMPVEDGSWTPTFSR